MSDTDQLVVELSKLKLLSKDSIPSRRTPRKSAQTKSVSDIRQKLDALRDRLLDSNHLPNRARREPASLGFSPKTRVCGAV